MSDLDDDWAINIIAASRLGTLRRLDELDDHVLLELHTALMQLRHRVVSVQRGRRQARARR